MSSRRIGARRGNSDFDLLFWARLLSPSSFRRLSSVCPKKVSLLSIVSMRSSEISKSKKEEMHILGLQLFQRVPFCCRAELLLGQGAWVPKTTNSVQTCTLTCTYSWVRAFNLSVFGRLWLGEIAAHSSLPLIGQFVWLGHWTLHLWFCVLWKWHRQAGIHFMILFSKSTHNNRTNPEENNIVSWM